MDTATIRRSRPRGEVRRQQILDAASAVFLEHGYARSTIELIVSRAGASKASIYSFFGDKEGLFSALIEERSGTILAGFPEIEIGDASVRAALAGIARQYMEVVMSAEVVGLTRLVLAEGQRFPRVAEMFFRAGQDRVTAHLAKAIRIWARNGRISAVDADRSATQFFDLVRGELQLRVVAGLPLEDLAAAIEKNISHAVRLFWRALKPDGGA